MSLLALFLDIDQSNINLSKLKPAIDQTTTAIDFINPFKVNKIGSGNFSTSKK